MKFLVVVASFVALCNAVPLPDEPVPTVPGDNSHYVEGQSRYIWMPDGDGVPHLVDLLEEPNEEELSGMQRNGAQNEYWLFTRSNPTSRQNLVNGNINSVRNSNYASNRPLKVIVHGWNNDGNSPVNTWIRDAFLAVADVNVIVVDWRRLASSGYNTAASGVPDIGRHLGNFLNWLIANAGGNWNNVHLVGFSLGAHVVGNAGRTVGNRPARITGLDPAGPAWGGNSNALRASDGQYVEAIHTDGRALGIMDAIGGANFYPNGGRAPQPGCGWISSCSHGRSYEFFAATVRYNRAVGRQCVNLAQAELNNCTGSNFHMGNSNVAKRGNGIFQLRSGNNWPFF